MSSSSRSHLEPPSNSQPESEVLDENNKSQLEPVPKSETDPEALKQLQARQHLFKERKGFTYHYVVVKYKKGSKFGLVIKSCDGMVMVSKLDPKSLCAASLKVGDHLIDVDGTPIKERESAKKLMLACLAATRRVSFIVERPYSSEAKHLVKTSLLSASTRTSSTAPREKERWAEKAAHQRKKAMSKSCDSNE